MNHPKQDFGFAAKLSNFLALSNVEPESLTNLSTSLRPTAFLMSASKFPRFVAF